ncbi:glycosyltransferase [Anaerolineae bacterium CFX9]|nr:glycosyltransferase [Anaerolineae bacterium CFX9]
MLPRITIVTPSYNQAAYIESTLISIHAQNYPQTEHIVIDGGSTDGSVDIIRAFDDRIAWWVSEPDAGQSDALNKGFQRSTGEIMTWLNSDDILLPGALQTVGEIFAAFPQVEWLTGLGANIDVEDHLRLFPLKTGRFRRLIQQGWYHGRALGFIRQEGTFWRRSLWERAGGQIDTHLHWTMDYALWRKMAQHADLYTVDRVLAAYRSHPAQKTAQLDRYYAEAGIRLPQAARIIALPLRAAFTLASWPFAPRIVQEGGTWQARP